MGISAKTLNTSKDLQMKLINNQDSKLLDELKYVLNSESEVFIASDYFTLPALFELSTELSNAKSVKALIDSSVDSDLRFSYDNMEFNK